MIHANSDRPTIPEALRTGDGGIFRALILERGRGRAPQATRLALHNIMTPKTFFILF
jgi:hypothetical protein